VSRLRAVLGDRARGEDGLTLVELLVASAMSAILLAAIGSMVVSTMRTQPQLSKKAQNVSSARYALERMTREVRNGVRVDQATPSTVSFLTYVRRTSCGSGVATSAATPAIKCEVTYQCTTTACTRRESPDGLFTGTTRTIFSDIGSSSVFCFVPSKAPDPLTCGEAASVAGTTYVGVRLQMPNPSGSSNLTVSDGASLRNATLLN
jgi:prepilin-type N-terminal cleavage/methylation domain-containing protein